MQLTHHIINLLKNHDCVIIPGFGGFIGNYAPSLVDRSMWLIFPPRKQVLFNPNLLQNDGLLANEMVRAERFSYPEAIEKIKETADEWKNILAAGNRIELGDLGFLFAQSGQVIFEQNRETNLLLQSYGLKQISFTDYSVRAVHPVAIKTEKPVSKKEPVGVVAEKKSEKIVQPVIPLHEPTAGEKETPVIALDPNAEIETVAETNEGTKVISLPERTKRNHRYKYIAAAVVLPVLFYSYWIPMETDALSTGKIQFSDLNPLRTQSRRVYAPRTADFNFTTINDWKSWEELTANLPADVTVYRYELDEDVYIPVHLVRESTGSESHPAIGNGGFHVIANCFSQKSNAEKFVDELTSKGYTSQIVDVNNGLHRVSAGSYATAQDAENALDSFKNAGYSGWILRP